MDKLTFTLLGNAQVAQQDQRTLKFRARKELALLLYLAAESHRAHSRESLLGLFWPEFSNADARNNLRVVLSRLKRKLDADSATAPYLLISRAEIRFNPASAHWVDVTEFQEIIQRTLHHAHQDRATCAACQCTLARAAALYQGDFLSHFYLDGCPMFDEWQLFQREQHHLQALEILGELTEHYRQRGELAEATRYARQQLALDPLKEQTYLVLMQILQAQGERGAALALFDRCRVTLRQELDVEPGPQLVHFWQQLKKNPQPIAPVAVPVAPLSQLKPQKLPRVLTSFVGRATEVAQLRTRLGQEEIRLITIAGPGGIGKSRLAIQIAQSCQELFHDGIHFVPLASVQQGTAIPAAILNALGVRFSDGRESPFAQLIDVVRQRRLLLILDNLEHLLESTDLLLQLLHNAPELTLLVTSRERLNVQAEDLFVLEGLPTPRPTTEESGLGAPEQQPENFAAVQLFCDRARRFDKSFQLTNETLPAVLRICALVEGMPLGLELAASWIGDFSCTELANALAKNLDLLQATQRDLAPKHQSMQAVFDYSWHLLTPTEQHLLSALAIFAGGFAATAAQEVAGGSQLALTQLRYKSLIRAVRPGRYDMHELVRYFAKARGQDKTGKMEARHAQYFLTLVAEQQAMLVGKEPQRALLLIGQELANIRQAWQWACASRCWTMLLSALSPLAIYYNTVGMFAVGEQWLLALLQLLDTDATALSPAQTKRHQQLRLTALLELVQMAGWQSKFDAALAHGQRAIALAREMQEPTAAATGYAHLGYIYQQQGEPERGRAVLQQGLALARQVGADASEALNLLQLGNIELDCGDRAKGEAHLIRALKLQQRAGNVLREQRVLLCLGVSRSEVGDHVGGHHYLHAALQLLQQTGNRAVESRVVNALGFNLSAMGAFEEATEHHLTCLQISQEIGQPIQESHAEHNLCTTQRKMGNFAKAEEHGCRALQIAVTYQLAEAESYAWMHLGYLWLDQDRWFEAEDSMRKACEGWVTQQRQSLVHETRVGIALALARQGRVQQAEELITPILPLVRQAPLAGTDEPMQILLNCYDILVATGDPAAPELLAVGMQQLRAKLVHITTPRLRRRMLEAVPAHRRLQELWRANAPIPRAAPQPGQE